MAIITFKHKTLGTIGEVSWYRSADGIAIDGYNLSDAAIDYIFGYGLKQTLADSYAFPKDKPLSTSEARDKFAAKLEAVIAGTIESGTRETDPVEKEVKRLARLRVTAAVANLEQESNTPAKLDEVSGKGTFAALVTRFIEKHSDALRTQAVANLEANAALGDIDDLLGDLTEEGDSEMVYTSARPIYTVGLAIYTWALPWVAGLYLTRLAAT